MKPIRLLTLLSIVAALLWTTGGVLAAGNIVHTVRPGENLLLLTKIYGVTGNRIRAANPGWADPNIMRPGERLNIPVEASTAPSNSTPFFYTVGAGENSLVVALKFEIDHLALARANGSRFYPFVVTPGQTLLIPAGPHLHIVRGGETLSGIAAAYCTTVDVLMNANGLADPSLVFAGQQILIPIHYNVQPCLRGAAAGGGAAPGAPAVSPGGPLSLHTIQVEGVTRDSSRPNGATARTRVQFLGGAAPFTLLNDGAVVGSNLTPGSQVEGGVTYAVLSFDQPATCPVVLNHTLRLVSADGQVVERVYFLGPTACP
jgi:LysM repeat protein